MARLARLCLPGIAQHVIQRGTNRHICFASDQDFSAYAHWLEACAVKFEIDIWGPYMTLITFRNKSA